MLPQSTIVQTLPDLRCAECNVVLMRGAFYGIVTLRCPKCRTDTVFLDGEIVLVQPRMRVEPADPARDLLPPDSVLRAAAKLDIKAPSVAEIVEMMEQRWDALFKTKAKRRAEVAVGMRFNVFVRDAFRCRYCGLTAADGAVLEADHVTPRSAGGLDVLENLVTACWECNRGKSAKDVVDSLPDMF